VLDDVAAKIRSLTCKQSSLLCVVNVNKWNKELDVKICVYLVLKRSLRLF